MDAKISGLLKKQKYAVVLAYDVNSIPFLDPPFPNIKDDYIYGYCLPIVGETENRVILEYKGTNIQVYKNKIMMIPDPGFKIGQEF